MSRGARGAAEGVGERSVESLGAVRVRLVRGDVVLAGPGRESVVDGEVVGRNHSRVVERGNLVPTPGGEGSATECAGTNSAGTEGAASSDLCSLRRGRRLGWGEGRL